MSDTGGGAMRRLLRFETLIAPLGGLLPLPW